MSTSLQSPLAAASTSTAQTAPDTAAALRFITCGSVDDGKSTLIGRLLLDSRAVLQDQLRNVTHQGSGQINAAELSRLTDGLQAEREQGITIDVAWRYFTSAARKFIIGDAPGHEQYTRNMVTAASQADCAVVLVDATKLPWAGQPDAAGADSHALLPQTRRHTLLAHLLRVPHIVFAVNKLDAVAHDAAAFADISAALQAFCAQAGITPRAIVPVSALMGWNVVDARTDGWCGYQGPGLLPLLETLPVTPADTEGPFAFPVQWIEKHASSADISQARRILWGRIASGRLAPQDRVTLHPSGQEATVLRVLDHVRRDTTGLASPASAGIVLDRELDISRGDWLLQPGALTPTTTFEATLAWLDTTPLLPGRTSWALAGHSWVKARVTEITHQLDIHTLERQPAGELDANAIGRVRIQLQAPLPLLPYRENRRLGSLILVDMASNATAAAALVDHIAP